MTEQRGPDTGASTTPATGGAEVLVRVENLKKYYPIYGGVLRRHVGDVKAVDDVSFEVRRGEVFGLVGESGCGKSTLGKTLIRLQPETEGRASISGEEIFEKIIEIASGGRSKSEDLGLGDNEFVPWQIGAVM